MDNIISVKFLFENCEWILVSGDSIENIGMEGLTKSVFINNDYTRKYRNVDFFSVAFKKDIKVIDSILYDFLSPESRLLTRDIVSVTVNLKNKSKSYKDCYVKWGAESDCINTLQRNYCEDTLLIVIGDAQDYENM